MPRQNTALLAFNRGLVSRLGLARVDLKRVAMSAEDMENWMPRVLGSMMLRPGLGYLDGIAGNDEAKFLPFVFSATDKALVELTDQVLRAWVDDEVITRPAVTTTITNGTFPTDLSGWTDDDGVGATSSWIAAGQMGLDGGGTTYARRYQAVDPGVNANLEHALHITIEYGPVEFKVGSTASGEDYVALTTLGPGIHSLAFTPTGIFYVQFQNRIERLGVVNECVVEAAGPMEVETPWPTAAMDDIRFDQSGDILFVACDGYAQWKIERRATRSWSVVQYQTDDGPFKLGNATPTTLAPAAVGPGNSTLTASVGFFTADHVGCLFAVTSTGQTVTKAMSVLNDSSNSVLVEGVGTDRALTIVITGFTGGGRTVILERSFDDTTWVAVSGQSWTGDITASYNDGLDNESVYYRLTLSVVGTAGTTTGNLMIATGSVRGIARVTSYQSSTVVNVEILTAFGGTTATDDWEQGAWSDIDGYPSAVGIAESRLIWAGRDKSWASATDDYYGYDLTAEGDAAAFSRTIGSGPVDRINWLLPLQRVILGGEMAEFTMKSTSFDEPLTPSNANLKRASTQGSAPVPAVTVDARGFFVQRGGTRVYELGIDGESLDYNSTHITQLVPKIGAPGIVRVAVQRQPDTRLHCVRSDGTAAVMVYDRVENVNCWLEITTEGADGLIEDVVVLPGDPGDEEDWVYYVVRRTINGATVRYLEKWALESEAIGGTLNKQADSFKVFTNSPASATVTGLEHLAGEEVVVWADGICLNDADGDIETFTVSASGTITLTHEGAAYTATTGVVGLYYEAPWKSAKLAQVQSELGVPLAAHKNIKAFAIVGADIHPQGLRYGPDFTTMDDLPLVEEGAAIDTDAVMETFNFEPFSFPGGWDPDARLCLLARAPRPVTLLAAIVELAVNG